MGVKERKKYLKNKVTFLWILKPGGGIHLKRNMTINASFLTPIVYIPWISRWTVQDGLNALLIN